MRPSLPTPQVLPVAASYKQECAAAQRALLAVAGTRADAALAALCANTWFGSFVSKGVLEFSSVFKGSRSPY